MKIKITVDSSADVSDEYLKENEVDSAKLTILDRTEEKEYLDKELSNEQLFELINKGHRTKTSCPSPIAFKQMFEKYLLDYDHVIHLNMSSKMSGSHNAALIGSEVSPKRISVIDTKNLTMALALILDNLVQNVKQSSNLNDILNQLKQDINNTEMMVILDTAKYVLAGGRIEAIKTSVLEKLGVRLSIRMEDGLPKPMSLFHQKKYRGESKYVALKWFETILQDLEKIDTNTIVFGTTEEITGLQKITGNLTQLRQFKKIITNQAGSVISSHVGPKTLAMAYMTKR